MEGGVGYIIYGKTFWDAIVTITRQKSVKIRNYGKPSKIKGSDNNSS